jgi:hypothetical protein
LFAGAGSPPWGSLTLPILISIGTSDLTSPSSALLLYVVAAFTSAKRIPCNKKKSKLRNLW